MLPWSFLHAQLHQRLRQDALISPGAGVLAAVSGGQDSMCLLQLLNDLRPKWNWTLTVVHCDHGWREDSRENASFVKAWCDRLQIPCRVETAESPPASEAAARSWRYQVFAALAKTLKATHVATGHTASDRAETLLYNLVRGSGADGLQALTWDRPLSPMTPDIRLVRPLLGITRAETAAFCSAFKLPVWEDSTNDDRTYARNRIRLDLLPYLAEHFNPSVVSTLAQTAEILTAEVAFLDQTAAQAYETSVKSVGDSVCIQRRSLTPLHLAIQRRVMRRVLQSVISGQVTFEQVDKLVRLIEAPNRSQSDPFPGGAIARVENDFIVLDPGIST